MAELNLKIKKMILGFQRNEITEYYVYKALSRFMKDKNNRLIMEEIADEEKKHYHIWHKYSGTSIQPNNFKKWFYIVISAIFGVTFGVKLMEAGENDAQHSYAKIAGWVPEAGQIQNEELEHEKKLIAMIDEDKLKYMGSMVLGLNDALVEFTGALAGFTFALRNSHLIAMTGIIMGFSASFSMAASEYLSSKAEGGSKNPLKASFYTGVAYIITVIVLVLPYFIFNNFYFSLLSTIGLAILLILIFTFFFSVVKEVSFTSRFLEMFTISISVAFLSFLIGLIVRNFLHVNV